ncbi:MAG: hypothetical protein ILN61_09490 [Lachnospiraceae bacterium]|nr:hypothetical protein [Lachnospiraceae bacterium]
MNDKIKQIKDFIAGSKEETRTRIDTLVADGRDDDARPFRAALNIHDVFVSLLDAAVKMSDGNEQKFVTIFKSYSENVPAQWRQSLSKAKEHNDAEKIMIEEAKVKIADAITDKFNELF